MSKIIYCVLIGFAVSILQGPLLIPVLHWLKFGQNIRDEGPAAHKKKAGTPTMGGIIFILATTLTLFVIEKHPGSDAVLALLAFIGFGVIGFLDDVLKIVHKHNEGLKPYQKMILLITVSGLIALYASKNIGTDVYIPFVNNTINLGKLYIPFVIIFFVATTNAVNLTDGLDGLATSVTLLVVIFFAMISYGMGNYVLANFSGILSGALLGFLRYNSYPAKIFMGDTGSLGLGGVVASIALVLKLPLIVIIVGGIYVVEVLSVILQVSSFKLTGKRIFRMSPLHHHFELLGWHESKIVAVFSIITVILCLIGFLSLSFLSL